MFTRRLLMTGLFLSLPAIAQTEAQPTTESVADECAQARDPALCTARQAALTLCAEKHGAEKQACLQDNLPPVDCSRADNPKECMAIEQAKEKCAGKKNAALAACLNRTHKSTRKNPPRKAKKQSTVLALYGLARVVLTK